ncbi:MAG: 2-hydroxyacid dehydrogenase [Propionibacteriaceae bacterium]|jgi:D-3-phosphoglycerate dehydrogenase|nr:2-hydroxyacid dehydrogenase [Propionibacteriaceae bacterium]
MKVLAIADGIISAAVLKAGLAHTPELTADLTLRTWSHANLADLQEDNLAVELRGPSAIAEPVGVFEGIEDYDVLITQFCPIRGEVIRRGSKLKAIGVLRAGIENVDLDTANELGVKVVNAPGRNANAVAEFAVGMILAETRNIARAHLGLRDGKWDRNFPNGDAIPELLGRNIGIVGMGQIGRRVAELVSAFGAKVSYFDPYLDTPEFPRYTDLAELAAAVDILTIHSRLTPETKHIVSADVIAALRPHAVLVNTARSGLVDEKAMIQALQERKIMGAAIDTFDDEPLPADSPFRNLDNVTITSHLAGSTADAMQRTPSILAPRVIAALG